MSARRPYDDILMEHIKNARNYRAIEGASGTASGANALCGDAMTVFVRMKGGRIEDIAFQCECCGVSMASASIMTEALSGASVEEARTRVKSFLARVAGEAVAARLSRGSASASSAAARARRRAPLR